MSKYNPNHAQYCSQLVSFFHSEKIYSYPDDRQKKKQYDDMIRIVQMLQ
jgi:hypothetical protein